MATDNKHRPGCPATGGYGHGVEPCICGADTTPAPTDALMPCPFCGASATGYAIEPHTHSGPLKALGIPDHNGSYVIEGNCSCGSGLIGEAEAEVTARWNRRAQPAASPAPVVAREPLTDERAKEVLWTEHLRWMNAAGLDTEGMRPTGEWLDHWLFYVRAIEAAHGITSKEGGPNAD